MPNGAPAPAENNEQNAQTIAHFRAVTAIDNDQDARAILNFFSWDLDRAVTAFIDNPSILDQLHQPPPPPATANTQLTERPQQPPTAPPPNDTDANNNQINNTNNNNNNNQDNTFVGRLPRWVFAIMSPFRFVWSVLSNMTTKLMQILSGPAFLIDSAPGNTPTRRFISFYESRYGDAHPDFFDGSYASALNAANNQIKFLLVYIHSESHRLTPQFCRSILNDELFISTANASFITWAGSVTQRDAASVHYSLRNPSFPVLAVIAGSQLQQGDASNAGNYGNVLSVRSGNVLANGGAQAAVNWLARVLQRHQNILEGARQVQVSRESDRLLRQQQDEEYQAALEADREREREAQREKEEQEKEEQRLQQIEERRNRKRESLGEEPQKAPGVASIVLRLPNGTRVGRRFLQDDSLEKVFDWAEVNGVDIEVACLVMSYPRKSLRYPEDASTTLQDAGLFPSAMLLLEERS